MRLEDHLKLAVARHGQRVAVMGPRGQHTYAELDLKSERLAEALQHRGVARGSRVVTFMDEGWEAVVSFFAVLKAGGVVCPVAASAPYEALAAAVDRDQPVAIVTEARLAGTVASAIDRSNVVRLIVLAGGDRARATDTCLSFEETVGRMAREPQLLSGGEDTDIAVLPSKEASLTHRQIADDAAGVSVPEACMTMLSLARPNGPRDLVAAIDAGATLQTPPPALAAASRQSVVGQHMNDDLPLAACFASAAAIG